MGMETEIGNSIGDALIVAAGFLGWLYYWHAGRQSRLDVVHRERLAAMDKGIPLPELPRDPLTVPKVPDPSEPLLHGIVWLSLGLGGMAALRLTWGATAPWPLALPLVFLGAGLILHYVLASQKR